MYAPRQINVIAPNVNMLGECEYNWEQKVGCLKVKLSASIEKRS